MILNQPSCENVYTTLNSNDRVNGFRLAASENRTYTTLESVQVKKQMQIGKHMGLKSEGVVHI